MASKSQSKIEENVPYDKAGATALSRQPASPVDGKPAPARGWQELRGHLEARLVSLRNWRQSWWTQNWSELAQYIEPKRSIWLTQSTGGWPTPNNMTRGRPINNSIVDPTATYAVRVCSSGLMSGLASPSRPWFKITPSTKNVEIDAEGKEWLDEVEDRIYTILAGSNFYNAFAQECEDLVVFGTGPCIIYEDEKDIIRCYNPVVGEYYLSSGATMRVDGLFRTFVMTVAQIVDFFDVDNCPDDIKGLWKAKGSSLDQERIVAHSIEPNFGIGESGVGVVPGNFTWREVYWVYGANSKAPMSMRGFIDQPFTAARWSTQSNDAYGRSPGMDVLPDVIQLQVETLRKAEAIEKQVRPPLVADMELKNQPSSILPGHVTYVRNLGPNSGMRPIYEVMPDIRGMMEDLREIQQRIQRGFFNDLFLMLADNPKQKQTAYEVAAKIQEKLGVLGPVVENLITESLKPKLKRIFGIAQRKGMLPPLPESLRGVPIDLEFISMLALAQKASKTGGLERIVALIGNMVAVYPEAKDLLNVDTYVREFSEMLDNPQDILFSAEEVAATRAAQAKAMQQQKAQQEIAGIAQTAKVGADTASVLANTQIGAGQTALSSLFGGA